MIPKKFLALVEAPLICARVMAQDKNSYRIATMQESIAIELRAELPGRFIYDCITQQDYPVVGDFVSVAINGGTAIIQSVLPRENLFARRGVFGSYELQPIAANLDTLFIVMAANRDFNLRRLERYLVAAGAFGVPAVIILNKIDLACDPKAFVMEAESVAKSLPVLPLSAVAGIGLDLLADYRGENKSIAFVGSSGVGKSTLINVLLNRDELAVGEIRGVDDRGRHTTTRRSLIFLDDGTAIIDTPGMREFALADAQEGVESTFSDLSELAQECRFRDCRHDTEPGCAVREGLDDSRLESWRKLGREAAFEARKREPRLAAAERQKWKSIHKEARKRTR